MYARARNKKKTPIRPLPLYRQRPIRIINYIFIPSFAPPLPSVHTLRPTVSENSFRGYQLGGYCVHAPFYTACVRLNVYTCKNVNFFVSIFQGAECFFNLPVFQRLFFVYRHKGFAITFEFLFGFSRSCFNFYTTSGDSVRKILLLLVNSCSKNRKENMHDFVFCP